MGRTVEYVDYCTDHIAYYVEEILNKVMKSYEYYQIFEKIWENWKFYQILYCFM